MADKPLLPGVRWLRIELSRSVAMLLDERRYECKINGGLRKML